MPTEQEALRRVATLVAREIAQPELCRAIAEEIRGVLGTSEIRILRFESDGSAVVVGSSGRREAFPVGSRQELQGDSVAARVLETGRTARIDDYGTTDGPLAETAQAIGIRAIVGAPVNVGGQLWGVVTAGSTEDNPLPPDTESRLARFIELMAIAIANAEARVEVQRLVDEQAALRRVATLVARGVEPAEIFSAVIDEVDGLFGPGSAAVLRFEHDGPAFVIVGLSAGIQPVIPVGSRWELEEGMSATEVHRTGHSARVENWDWSLFRGPIRTAGPRLGFVSTVASPIVVDGRLWGAMNVNGKESLPPDTEQRLEKFTELLATAIANAESKAELAMSEARSRRLAGEQAALRRVATVVAHGVAPADLFSAVTNEVALVFSRAEAPPLATVIRFDPGPECVLVGASRPYEFEPVGSRWEPKDLYVSTRVLHTGRSARVDEADLETVGGPDADVLRLRGFLYQVGSPIVVEGRLWGAMTLNSSEALPADTDESLENFTELIATAIANAESRSARERLSDEQAALRRVATLVAEGAAPADLFAAVAVEVAAVVGVTSVSVSRFLPDGCSVVLASHNDPGFPVGSQWRPDEGTINAAILEAARPARIDQKVLSGPIAEASRVSDVRSAVGAPIVVEGSVWGMVAVGRQHSDEPLPPQTETRLAAFTELIATAVSNAEARDGLRLLADEQAALRHVATLVARDAPSSDVLEAVATEVGKLLETDITIVGRFDEDGAATAIGNWSASPGGVPVGTRSKLGGRNVLTMVAETGKPARMDEYGDASGEAAEIARRHGWRSSIAAPIAVEGRLWGVMLVATRRPEPFPAGAEERLEKFTELVATAIANAESRAEVDRLAKEQAALRRVATLVAEGADPTDVFSAVSAEISRLFDAGLASVERFLPDGSAIVTASVVPELEGVQVGMRWELEDWMAATHVCRTGRSARVDQADWPDGGSAIADLGNRLGITSTAASPIVVEGQLWGAIIVSATAEPLATDAEERLERFTKLVGMAIANAESQSEVAASRRRIVAASDDTRRRIERDLHDGTQQRLVSLGLAVRAAEAHLPPERDDLRAELSDVAMGLAAAVEDLQEISRGIHPAILSKGGLGPALQTLAHRSAIPVGLDVRTDDVRFAEPIEVAAYFVASEALANATKHSQASRIDVRLEQPNGTLVLTVRDDGVGGADPSGGSGLVGLRDRVEALGGSISVESPHGNGTRITAELPVELESPP